MSKQRTPIEIWSDVACPWCAIGERRFFRALDARPDRDAFEVTFRAFELDPAAPRSAEPLRARLAARYGPRADAMLAHAGAAAASEGMRFDWDRALAARTRDAHRLLALAARQGGGALQRRLAERLFAAQFEHGGDVSSADELAAHAAAAGIDPATAKELLAGDDGEAEVAADLARARRLGIRSVPTFVFDDRLALSGAQSVSTFAAVLRELAAEAAAAPAPGDEAAPEGCDDGACEVAPTGMAVG